MHKIYPVTQTASAERLDYFTSLVDSLFCPMECAPASGDPRPFTGGIETASVGNLQITNVTTTPVVVRRRRRDIARMNHAPWLIKFQMEGQSRWSQCGAEVLLKRGDFVICYTAEPYELKFDGPYKMPVLALPDATMRHLTPNPHQFLGRRMPADDACCGLLSAFVEQVVGKMAQLPAAMAERVETNVLDLLGGVLNAHAATAHRVPGSASDQVAHVLGFIADNLRNRRLGPAMIADSLGVSVRTVQKLFAARAETASGYIRQQRLEASRKMLLDPAQDHLSITDIALHWGYYDLSHMTRSFTDHFGRSPSRLRHEHRGATSN